MVVLLVIYVPNIKEVFGLAGATVATMLVIIMPAGFYYKVINRGLTHFLYFRTLSCFVKITSSKLQKGPAP